MTELYEGRVALKQVVQELDRYLKGFYNHPDNAAFENEPRKITIYRGVKLILTNMGDEARAIHQETGETRFADSYVYRMLNKLGMAKNPLSTSEMVRRLGWSVHHNYHPRQSMYRISEDVLGEDALVRDVSQATKGLSEKEESKQDFALRAARYELLSLDGLVAQIEDSPREVLRRTERVFRMSTLV